MDPSGSPWMRRKAARRTGFPGRRAPNEPAICSISSNGIERASTVESALIGMPLQPQLIRIWLLVSPFSPGGRQAFGEPVGVAAEAGDDDTAESEDEGDHLKEECRQ